MTDTYVVVSNYDLLLLIDHIDGKKICRETLIAKVSDTDDFKLLSENEMLREQFKMFLQLDRETWKVDSLIKDLAWYQYAQRASMKKELAALRTKRNAAMDQYEMIRKLSCDDHPMLTPRCSC